MVLRITWKPWGARNWGGGDARVTGFEGAAAAYAQEVSADLPLSLEVPALRPQPGLEQQYLLGACF